MGRVRSWGTAGGAAARPGHKSHLRVLRGPGDEHVRALLVVQGLHVHEGAEVVQLLGQRRLRLVPDDLRVGAEVLDIRSPLAVPDVHFEDDRVVFFFFLFSGLVFY